MTESLKTKIEECITSAPVVLFIKGDKQMQQCGFSATVVDIFRQLNTPIETFNILEDPELRSGMKEFTNWPTFPQIYVHGKFIGGCDIAIDMFESGELKTLVSQPSSQTVQ